MSELNWQDWPEYRSEDYFKLGGLDAAILIYTENGEKYRYIGTGEEVLECVDVDGGVPLKWAEINMPDCWWDR